jgi:hypothetical protein
MPVIVVATIKPLPEYRDEVTHSTDSAGLQTLNAELKGKLEAPLDVVVLEPVPAGEPAKGAL